MVTRKYRINWDEQARTQLRKAYEYIKNDSLQNADKFRSELIKTAKSLSENPERFPLDKNKDNNDGSYRAFVKYKYRVSYRILEDHIRIFRVRSERQEPLQY